MVPRERMLTVAPKEKWGNQREFMFATISLVVSLGNIWRFPWLCYKNGGGTFLIPYLICLLVAGLPMFFLEIGMGQYSGEGGITAWETFGPRFKGIGIASAITCFLVNIYYVVFLAWAFHYLFASFAYELPWSKCNNYWNTDECSSSTGINTLAFGNITTQSATLSASTEYWENRVLGLSKSIQDLGSIQWELAATLLLSWIIVYFCLWKGIRSLGKVAYATSMVPFLLLTFLMVLGLTLDGAWEGIRVYLTPDFSAILSPQVWTDAATQVFFSHGVGLGCLTALGSYNKPSHDFTRDCKLIAIVNFTTSFFAGFVVFSTLGFIAQEHGVAVTEVAKPSLSLAFIVYPKALSLVQWAPFWSILFFSLLVLLGLGAQIVGVESFVTAIVDAFPHIFRVGYRRQAFLAAVVAFSYLVGLFMVTNGGLYVLELFDQYCFNGMIVFLICFCQSSVIAGYYGESKVDTLLGYSSSYLHLWLRLTWKYFAPIFTLLMLLYSVGNYTPAIDYHGRPYPMWAHMIGWNLCIPALLSIPFYFVCYQPAPRREEAEKLRQLFP